MLPADNLVGFNHDRFRQDDCRIWIRCQINLKDHLPQIPKFAGNIFQVGYFLYANTLFLAGSVSRSLCGPQSFFSILAPR